MEKQKRIYSLDALKFFAAVMIVFHHFQLETGTFFEGRINFYGGAFYFGYLVEFFFLISGYVSAIGTENREQNKFSDYIVRKLIRLYPMAMASILVYCIVAWGYRVLFGSWWNGYSVGLYKMLVSLLLIFSGGVINVGIGANNVTWYVCVLLLCYIFYWMILWIAQRLHVTPVYMYIFMIFVGLGIGTYGINAPFFNLQSSRGYTAFFSGVLLNYIMNLDYSRHSRESG